MSERKSVGEGQETFGRYARAGSSSGRSDLAAAVFTPGFVTEGFARSGLVTYRHGPLCGFVTVSRHGREGVFSPAPASCRREVGQLLEPFFRCSREPEGEDEPISSESAWRNFSRLESVERTGRSHGSASHTVPRHGCVQEMASW